MKPRPQISADVLDLIRRRWSPRAFSSEEIDEETVLTLIEAARWAASAMNEQPWRFIYATKQQSERYCRLFDCLNERNQVWATTAPVLIMTLVKTQFESSSRPNKWALHDLGLAVGNLTTQASAMDLYVHTMGGFSSDTARRLFNLPPDIEPVTMIAVGYLGDPEQLPETLRQRELAPQQRRSVDDLILK
jgi:nitroreductase